MEENKSFHTNQEVFRAKQAKKVLSALVYPTLSELKALIWMNQIQVNPIETKDVDLIKKVYGPEVATIKGRTTRKRPTTARLDTIKVPKELHLAQHNVELCIDAMFVNNMPFLTSISHQIKYRAGQWVSLEEPKCCIDQLSKLLLMYKICGFQVVHIFADNAFELVLEALKTEFAFQPNCVNAQEHVPEAERNHWEIKERVRACFHNSPYKALLHSSISLRTAFSS